MMVGGLKHTPWEESSRRWVAQPEEKACGGCNSSLPTAKTKARLSTGTCGRNMRNNGQIKTRKSMTTVKHWNRDPERLQNLYPREV